MTAPETAFTRLHHAATALGCRLFTVTIQSADGESCWRAHTSHPREYPLSGVKPVARDAWFDQVITRRESFLANTPAEFEALFFDHALITSLGLGSALNIPVCDGAGTVLGTANFLAGTGHFTPDRTRAYHDATRALDPDLARAMAMMPQPSHLG